MNSGMQTIILGLGNELLGDEGGGVHAARLLQRLKLPLDTKVIEVGTATLNSVSEWEEADRIIVVDAMKGDGTPGTLYKILSRTAADHRVSLRCTDLTSSE